MARRCYPAAADGNTRKKLRSWHEPKKLPHLPQEIIDIIITFATELPNKPRHGTVPEETLPLTLYRNEWLSVSSTSRQSVLRKFAYECIWIEVLCYPSDWTNIYPLCAMTPLLPRFWEERLPPDKPTITLNWIKGHDASIASCDNGSLRGCRLIFPFNYQSLLCLLSDLRREASFLICDYFQVSCRNITTKLQPVLQHQVSPLIRDILDRDVVGSVVNADSDKEAGFEDNVGAHRHLTDLRTTSADRFEELQRSGLYVEADLFALHVGNIMLGDEEIMRELQPLRNWAERELTSPGWEYNTHVIYELRTRRAILENELRAHEGFVRMWRTDNRWATIHGRRLSRLRASHSRWTDEPDFTWFGASREDLCKWHYGVARIQMTIAWTKEIAVFDICDKYEDIFDLDDPIEETNILEHLQFALGNDMDNKEYCAAYSAACQKYFETGGTEEDLCILKPRMLTFRNIDNEEQRLVGSRFMMKQYCSGDQNLLPLMSRAERLAHSK